MLGVNLMNVAEFLHTEHVPFEVLPHRNAYTAQHLAHTLDVPGDNVAKTVLLNVDGKFVLAVLPATHQVSLSMLEDCLHADCAQLATEEELAKIFPDCERGVAPPFGTRYGLTTIVARSLTDDERIVFEGNSHSEAICLRYYDYAKIENPRVESFTCHV
jgi:Ala-tRNA(Pro) deacylase